MALRLGSSEAKKSFVYQAPLHSGTFRFDRILATGCGCKLEGFRLEELTLGEGTEGELLVRLSPGKFVSGGVVVEILSSLNIHIPRHWEFESSIPGISIYGYTESPFQNANDVFVSYSWEKSIKKNGALLGQVYFDYDGTDGLLDDKDHRSNRNHPTWLPAPEAMMSKISKPDEEFTVATMALPVGWTNGSGKTTSEDITITPPTANVSITMGYEVNSTIPLDSSHHMVFASGRLLVEGLDYFLDSPGRAIVWSKSYSNQVQPYVTGSWGITHQEASSGSFDVFATKSMSFRHDVPFSPESGSELKIPENDARYAKTTDVILFGNGYILSPDQYSWDKDRGTLVIKKKNGGYLDNSGTEINFVSVIGLSGTVGVDSVFDGSPKKLYTDMSEHVSFSSTRYAAVGSQNSLQVWVDGRLTYADHGLAASDFDMVSAGMTGSNIQQYYCMAVGPDKFEVSADPMLAVRSSESSVYSSYSIDAMSQVTASSVVAARFSTANVGFEYRPLVIKPFSIRQIDEFENGVDVAIYNTYSPGFAADTWPSHSSPRHFSGATTGSEFFNASGFNDNYFVTYDSFMGMHPAKEGDHIYPGYDGQDRYPDKYRSVFTTMDLSIDLLSDVPRRFGESIVSGTSLAQDEQDPEAGLNAAPRGNVKLTDDYGLYRNLVSGDSFFSDLNPVMSYASLESAMYKWLDTFGSYYEKANGDKEYARHLGIEYLADGSISSSFASFLSSNTQLRLGIAPTDSLVSVIESVAAFRSNSPRSYGWGMGYMWGNIMFDLENGVFHGSNKLSKLRYPAGTLGQYIVDKPVWENEYDHDKPSYNKPHWWKSDTRRQPFERGTYVGNIGFVNPRYISTGSFNELIVNRTYKSSQWSPPSSHQSADPDTGVIVNSQHGDGGYPLKGGKNWNSPRGTYTHKKGSVNNFFCNVSPVRHVRGAVPTTWAEQQNDPFHKTDWYIDWCREYDIDGTNGEEKLKGVPKLSYWLEDIEINGTQTFCLRTYIAYGCFVEPVSFFVIGDTRFSRPNYAGHSLPNSSENYFIID